jgi:hypothetical protein
LTVKAKACIAFSNVSNSLELMRLSLSDTLSLKTQFLDLACRGRTVIDYEIRYKENNVLLLAAIWQTTT